MKRLKNIVVCFGLLAFGLLNSAFHPFHLSVTDLKYNSSERTLEISTKLFINDLEEAIKRKFGKKLDLFLHADDAESKNLLNQYIQQNLQISLDNKNISFTLLGSEREDNALWVYLETPVVAAPSKVSLSNNLLFDLFEDQTNIIHFDLNGQRKSKKLNAPNGKCDFTF
jgi:hypothetical protein